MKLGISTYTYTWSIGVPGNLPAAPMSALDLLDRAQQLNVRVVQMADNLPLDQLSPADLDAFANCATERGIQVEVGTRGIEAGHLRKYLALAKRFHSPILRVVLDTAHFHPTPDEAVSLLHSLQTEFEAAGVTLAIENHDRFQTFELAQVVRSLGSWTGICLDTVNSFGALEGPGLVLDRLGPLTVNLHVKDFTIFRATHMMGFMVEGRPAGQGRLDVPWLVGELKRRNRHCNAILELWTPPEATLEATIAKEQRWAEESIAYLRALITDDE
jgi:sugar phosphate isomerase/epimerase